MTAIPSPQQRCIVHEWCTVLRPGHRTHIGEVHLLATSRGTRLRVSLVAEDRSEPFVHLEAAFHAEGPLLEVAELDPAEAVELAGMFLRLARVGRGTGPTEAQR